MNELQPIEIKGWYPERPYSEKVDAVLDSWIGTPYLGKHRIKAMGVDCYQIVAAFLDEMFGQAPGFTKLPSLSSSVARHRPDLARNAIKILRNAHQGSIRVTDGIIQPGDVLVVKSNLEVDSHLHEGHTMIATSTPWSVVHAVEPRVCRTTCDYWDIVRIYRAKGRAQWL